MKKVLVLSPSLWDEEAFASPAGAGFEIVYDARDVYDDPRVLEDPRFDVYAYVDALVSRHQNTQIAGVIGTGDYPGSQLAAAVAERLRLPAPPLKAILELSHKYYSRQIQHRAVPEATPRFASIDPLGARTCPLPYPYFVKPVKGTMSMRARMVHDARELEEALAMPEPEHVRLRRQFRLLQDLLDRAGRSEVPVDHFIAESPLKGVQVTVDGFVEQGRAVIMGIVDSVMYPGTNSFMRFDYPSALSDEVQARMSGIAARIMETSGFDQSCFNIEMFYDATSDDIKVIEVNPRMAYQFSDLYQRVDGTHTHTIQLALATGEKAPWQKGQGRDRVATSFVWRVFEDRRVVRAPSDEDYARVQARFPGTIIKPMCRQGEKLSDHDQDVGSYRVCITNMGASDWKTLDANYAEAKSMLLFVLEPL